jgi:transposase
MARPTKRTPDRERRLLQAIREGNTRKAAAAYAGVDQDTIARWCHRSADFADNLSRAEAESEVALVAIVRKAAVDDWRAAAHLLERRWPETWGRRERIDVRVDIEQHVRELAAKYGIDVDEALLEAQQILNAGNASTR